MHSHNPYLHHPRPGDGLDSMRDCVIRYAHEEARTAFKNEPEKYTRFFDAFLEANRVFAANALDSIEERLSKVADSLEEKPQLVERWNDDIGPKLRTITQHAEAERILKRNRELWAFTFADIVRRRCKDEVRGRFLRIFCRFQGESIAYDEFCHEAEQLFRDNPLVLEIFRSFVANPHGDHD